ncbi:MAG: hypothetical protein ACFFHD_16410 [Promethearchaeota archaeon]
MIDLINHYPWLPSLKEYYSDIASQTPSNFIDQVFSSDFSEDVHDRLLNLFEAAFQNLENIDNYIIDRINVYTYLILKILLYVLDNKIISNRLANLLSKINFNEMLKENEHNLYYICEDLKLDVLYREEPWEYGRNIVREMHELKTTNFKIHYTDYLKLASKLRDEYRKLIHNSLSDGYVFIHKRSLVRLIQEYIREKIISEQEKEAPTIEALKKEVLSNKLFKDIYDHILNDWAKREEEFEFSFEIDLEHGESLTSFYPPCIEEILKKAQEGQNLIHNERLFVVWFLLNLNYPVDSVVNLFSTLPDFDEKMTKYQVNYAKKKAYTPYKCSSLKSLNLCMAEKYKDLLCLEGYGSKDPSKKRKIAHPLAYIRVMQYRESKSKKTT